MNKRSSVPRPRSPANALVIPAPKQLHDGLLRFSFKYLQVTHEKFNLDGMDRIESLRGYLTSFLERLRHLSAMKVSEFCRPRNHAIRAHTIKWGDTSEPDGFSHLSEQMQACEPWQFSISANEHGRVHGILLDSVFYVIWFDPDHRLYE